jgi:hypothetical protein
MLEVGIGVPTIEQCMAYGLGTSGMSAWARRSRGFESGMGHTGQQARVVLSLMIEASSKIPRATEEALDREPDVSLNGRLSRVTLDSGD